MQYLLPHLKISSSMLDERDSKVSLIVASLVVILLISIHTSFLVYAVETKYLYLKVSGESMEPALTDGDTVKVRLHVDGESIKVGDIIVYGTIVTNNPCPDSMWIGHRVVEKYMKDGEWVFKTKGDNVPQTDPWEVPKHFLIGVVVEVLQGNVKTTPPNSSSQFEPLIPNIFAGELGFGMLLGIFIGLLFIMIRKRQ